MDLAKCRSGVKCISILLFLCLVVRPAASEPQKVGAISFLIGGPGDVVIKKASTDLSLLLARSHSSQVMLLRCLPGCFSGIHP